MENEVEAQGTDSNGQQEQQLAAQQSTEQQPDFAALFDSVVDKRLPGILKSVLKDNGVQDDSEVKEIINAYRSSKSDKDDSLTKQLQALQQENTALKAAQAKTVIDTAISKVAGELEVDPKRITQLSKLASGLPTTLNDDGTVDEAAIKTALEKALEDVPEFKSTNQSSGFQIGADGSQQQAGNSVLERVQAAAGIKKKE